MNPYNPLNAPDFWGDLDEDEKLAMVKDFVRRNEKDIEGWNEHAALHVIVENQVAEGNNIPVAEAIARLQGEGLNRHEALHAIGYLVIQHMCGLSGCGPFDKEEYLEAVRNWSSDEWFESCEIDKADAEFDLLENDFGKPAPTFQRDEPKIGRNDACPCGSGKKYKKCCGKN